MNNLPRQKLCEIIAKYGRSLCDEPRCCEGLLRDLCGEHKREINVLVGALKERIAADLLASSPNVPHEVLLARLVKRLQDDLAFTEDAARWAVESWALALGVISSAEVERRQKVPEPLSVPFRREPVSVPSAEEAPKTQPEVEYPKPGIPSATIINSIDGAETILIPAGEFIMGTSDEQIKELLRQFPSWKREWFADEQPQHRVYLDAFYIDKYPVTNAQFEQFVKAKGHESLTGYKAEGKKELTIHCLDLPGMNKLYGTEPVFIFDPDDDSNQPAPGYHDNALAFWPIYPQFLRNLFTKAFTDGISDPQNGRVRESEWRAAMVRLRDSIVYCAYCAMENFYDSDALKASGGKPGSCWSCKRELRLPPRIRIGRNVVMLNHDTKLFLHHIDDQKMYDFSQPTAEVTQHPNDPRIWGLKNLSDEKWVSTTTDGTVKDVEPGRSVTLAVGTKINFGKMEGEIRM